MPAIVPEPGARVSRVWTHVENVDFLYGFMTELAALHAKSEE
jgi:hypothetical protein